DVVVDDSLFSRSSFGVFLRTLSGTVQGTIERCRFADGGDGVMASTNSNVVIRDSVATGNTTAGFFSGAGSSQLDVENSLVTHNNAGLRSAFGGMRVSQTTIEENTTGLFTTFGGTIASFGNNRLAGNGT